MRRVGCITGIVAGALLGAGVADAAPTLRLQVDQSGDFVMIGNTLAHDCAAGVPAPVVGTVGNCGTNTADSSPDVFWRAADANEALANNTITLAQSRSTAVLALPAGAQVTHAFLYWAGESTAGNQADLTATIERPGAFSEEVTAVGSATSAYQASDYYYQSVANVTQLVQQHGAGAYRVSGVQTQNLVNRADEVVFTNWTLVVFYQLDTDPPRNLAIFDGLDLVAGASATATLSGFLVPNAGFDAKLGVIAYEGDGSITGDQLRFGTGTLGNADRLSDAQNPLTNFFNSTRAFLGTPVSNVGDLPQLTGTASSMGSFDIDVVDITSRLVSGQTSANIEATTTGDVYFLGAFITSISTYKPNFATSTKTVTDVNGGGLLPGDVLRYTINVINTGNDTAVNVELADQLPPGVSFRPGTLQIVSGPNAGAKTDAADTDQAEFVAGSNTVYFRLGTGANGTMGGSLPIGGTTTMQFEVIVNANASGTIENQAVITAEGDQGAPQENTPTDGNGSGSGAPPTVIVIDACGVDADCTDPSKPLCHTAPNPNVCVQCFTAANCSGTTPVCDGTLTCVGCASDSNCSGATPACQPSGACGQCSATNSAQCTGTTPVCDVGAGTCVGCTSDSNCSGATPACQASGACGQCSATNTTACTGSTPLCNVASGTCVGCLTGADCGGNTPVCSAGVCVGCSSDGDCGGSTPACQTATGACVACTSDTHCSGLTPTCDTDSNTCTCVPTGAEVCGNLIDEDCDGQLDNGCQDTDGDGLSDQTELLIGTDPNDADSDDDGVPDGDEIDPGTDTDGDGLINALDPDSDNDGLFDGTEMGYGCSGAGTDLSAGRCIPDGDLGATKTDPLNADTDGGGVTDGSEDANLNGVVDTGETDPTVGNGADDATVVDTDGDGLSDALENFLGSDPNDADSDDDGLLDGQEPNPSDDNDRDGVINLLDVDSDNDGLFDGTEMGKTCDDEATDTSVGHCIADGDGGATTTFPLLWDTDGGGVGDGSEDFNLNGVVDAGETDPTTGNGADDGTVVDSDGDGLSDGLELFLGSDPNDADSDDDGLLDGQEFNPSADTDGDGDRNVIDADSDGDGLFDGTEAGKDCSDDATDPEANTCVPDGDQGATTTSPLLSDTDGGGISDGIEDTNKNGVVDPGERDPNDPTDDMLGEPCENDAECGGPTSGIVCDGTSCVPGCRGQDGNGCPDGEVCTSVDETIGECIPESDGGTGGSGGAGGAGGTGGVGGAGGTSGTGGTAGTGATGGMGGTGAMGGTGGASGTGGGADAGTDEEGVLEGGGCSCTVPGSGSAPLGLGLLTVLAGLMGLRSRRRPQ